MGIFLSLSLIKMHLIWSIGALEHWSIVGIYISRWKSQNMGICFLSLLKQGRKCIWYGALWEMEVSRLMAAIVYLLPQLPTNYHYSMLIHEIKLYYQSALTACLGAPEGQREVLTEIFILFVISMFWAYQIPSCLINICNFYVFFCLSKIVCMCFHLGKCLAKKSKDLAINWLFG